MKLLTLEQFMNTYGLKNQTMTTSDLIEKLSMINIKDVNIYPSDSIVTSRKVSVILMMGPKVELTGLLFSLKTVVTILVQSDTHQICG